MKQRSPISVVIATYNGGKYISQQLKSILTQLVENDEVIIVDDCSVDNTLEIIKLLNDKRIIVFKNKHNNGVVSSFNRGLSLAKNEIIFLSDQDDVWFDNKCQECFNIFNSNKNIVLVASDALVINENGVVLNKSLDKLKGKFKYGVMNTIIKNRIPGCTIAFKRSLLTKVLPIPSNVPMHDIWLLCIAQMYGEIQYINKPLIYYRRHHENVTKDGNSGILCIVKWRLLLIYNLSLNVWNVKFKTLFNCIWK